MILPSIWQYTSNYKISTDVYEGPLDLLLNLIEKAELDITKLSLAKVTQQYLDNLQMIADRDPVEVSAFLVIATKLVLIKSVILLPSQSELLADEEDLGDQLARQLIEYKQYKDKALWMKERQEDGFRNYYRVTPPPRINEKLDLSNLQVYDLVDILLNLYFQHENVTPMSDVVAISAVTIKNRITALVNLFKQKPNRNLKDLLPDHFSRLDLVVTSLALLELIKNHSLMASQTDLFADISFESTENLVKEFDTEF
jgi:segregation and condensation protein A